MERGKKQVVWSKKKTRIARKIHEYVNKITERVEEIESDLYEQEILRYYPTFFLRLLVLCFSLIRGDS